MRLNILWQLIYQGFQCLLSVSYCMVCACVREGSPRALASGLSPIHAHNHTITALWHQHACTLCTF